MRIKRIFTILIIGGVGGFLTSSLLSPVLIRANFLGTGTLLAKISEPRIITKVEEKTVFVPKTDYSSEAIEKVKNYVVAIQSFDQGKLIRSGSGLILTQDGLIMTANSVVPPEAEVIQVIHQGEVLRAKVLYREAVWNTALLAVAKNNLQVARLQLAAPALGKSLLVFGKTVSFGSDDPLLNNVVVTQVNPSKKILKISQPLDPNLFGAALAGEDGLVLGLVDFKNAQIRIIPADTIEQILKTYLASSQTK